MSRGSQGNSDLIIDGRPHASARSAHSTADVARAHGAAPARESIARLATASTACDLAARATLVHAFDGLN